MPVVLSCGTACSTTAEQTLYTSTENRTYVFVVDAVNMLTSSTDELEIRAKVNVISTGTVRTAYSVGYRGLQALPVKYSVPVPAPNGISFTLAQPLGTFRGYDWQALSLST